MTDDNDDEPVYHGDVYWDAVSLIATFARNRAKTGDVTEATIVEVFARNVMKELAQPED